MNQAKASLESQFGDEICAVGDSEEMFWLREADDYQSKVLLGNALSSQYRFRDAIDIFEEASCIRANDPMLYIRLGGAYLTLFKFEKAFKAYNHALTLGANLKSTAYPLGVWHYLKGSYTSAAEYFSSCLPCDDELKIAVIYWHTLCCLRAKTEPFLLTDYNNNMDVGHHTAYLLAVSVFTGEVCVNSATEELANEKNDLNYIIAAYGICEHLSSAGKAEEKNMLIKSLLKRNKAWPCISYLAAYKDEINKTDPFSTTHSIREF